MAPVVATPSVSDALDFPGNWTVAGAWQPQETGSLDGVDVLAVTPPWRTTNTVSVTVPGPGVLHYSFRFELGPGGEAGTKVSVSLNGVSTVLPVGGIGAGVDPGWHEASLTLDSGDNVIEWKAANLSAPTSTVYLDQVWLESDPRPRLLALSAQSGQFGQPFSWQPPVQSPTPYTLSATGLPPGLSVGATGTIEGMPTEVGRFISRIVVTNATGSHYADQRFIVTPASVTLADALDTSFAVTESHGGLSTWQGGSGIGVTGGDAAWVEFAEAGSAVLSLSLRGPGVLRYWHREDQPSVYPGVQTLVHVGGVIKSVLSTTTWTDEEMTIPAGPQSVTWEARSGGSGGVRWDLQILPLAAYVDNLRFEPTTIPPQSTFAAWVTAWNIPTQPSVDYSADADGDGLGALMEYATGGDPYTADPGKLPTISVVDGHLTLSMPKAPTPTDLLYIVQSSKTLAANSWTSLNVELLEEDENHILARCKKTVAEEPTCNLRVKVLLAP